MFSLGVLRHALRMLLHDPWATIRITILPIGLGAAAGRLAEIAIMGEALPDDELMSRTDPRALLAVLASLFCEVAGIAWAAVGWHRWGLLSEAPGAILPRFDAPLFWSYFWISIKIALIILACMVPLLLAAGALGLSTGNSDASTALLFLGVLFILALSLRYSLALPAAAIGLPMTLGAAFHATRGYTHAFILLSAVLSVISLAGAYIPVQGVPGLALQAALTWFSLALGLSVLTTLYGTLVEKRDLT